MTGEPAIATAPASVALCWSTPSSISAPATARPDSSASARLLSVSQGLSRSQRGRMRAPSSNTSRPTARSISGFQASSSARATRLSASGLASAPTSIAPSARGRPVARRTASPASSAMIISTARPSTGSAPRSASIGHSAISRPQSAAAPAPVGSSAFRSSLAGSSRAMVSDRAMRLKSGLPVGMLRFSREMLHALAQGRTSVSTHCDSTVTTG